MLYRTLGKTGLQLSEIGLGCASYWGKKSFDENEAVKVVHAAADKGVTFFDTGSSYSGGNAEPRLGLALKGLTNKNDLVISTKAGTRIGVHGKLYKDFSQQWIEQSVDNSLKQLGLDAIPLLHLHGPQITDLNENLITAMEKLRQSGKVKHFSVNSFDMPVIEHVMTLPIFGAVMIDYNILRAERSHLIEKLAEKNIGIFAGMALAGGLYSRNLFRIRDLRSGWYFLRALKNHRQDMLRGMKLRFIEDVPGLTGAQVALAWVLANPLISCAVLGTTRASHMVDAVAASGVKLDKALMERIAVVQDA